MHYKMTMESLASFLGDVKMNMKVSAVTGCGTRVNGEGTAYPVEFYQLDIAEPIQPHLSSFLNLDGSVTVHIGIDPFHFHMRTTESSRYYGDGKHLSFEFKAGRFENAFVIPACELNSGADFFDVLKGLQEHIECLLTEDIKCFNKVDEWNMHYENIDIKWDTYSHA